MKRLYFFLVLLLGLMLSSTNAKAYESSIISGSYYRLVNVSQGTGHVMTDDNNLITTAARNESDYFQLWKITSSDVGYTIQNAVTGNYIQGVTTNSERFHTGRSNGNIFYAHLQGSGTNTSYAFNASASSDTYTALHCNSSGNVVSWVYNNNNNSYWYLEKVTLTSAQSTALVTLQGKVQLKNGSIYRFDSYYANRSMVTSNNSITTATTDASAYSQMWVVEIEETNATHCTIKNLLTNEYIQTSPGTSSQYHTGTSPYNFYPHYKESSGNYLFSFQNTSGYTGHGLHCAETQSYTVVGWDWNGADASWWTVSEVTLTQAQQDELANIETTLSTDYTTQLATFFEDAACTILKSTYAEMSEADLRTAMGNLPTFLQDMAVSVSTNIWTTKSDGNLQTFWNLYEKDFRIHSYDIFSNCDLWYEKLKIGRFSHLFHPTGITVTTGQFVYLFVSDEPSDPDVTLEVEIVPGTEREGAAYPLHHGYNAIYAPNDGEVFISYLLNNVDKSCNSYPDVKVHIEGGTCTGCFDMRGHHHTNTEWLWLKTNMFPNATYLHVKGNSVMLNVYRESVVSESNAEGVMNIWDFIFDQLQSLSGCDSYKESGHYKMMVNPFDNGTTGTNPFWNNSIHGSSHPGLKSDGLFCYSKLANIGTDGGQIWEAAHELAHGHQDPINLAGQTESSNNSLVQCLTVMAQHYMGTNKFQEVRSSRGDGVKGLVSRFNQDGGYSWIDYGSMRTQSGDYNDVWISNKMIFQLWLYFDYLGYYQPNGANSNTGYSFITELYERMRGSGLVHSSSKSNPGLASKDYLLLAKYASQITQTDLSEFFEAWGFWKLEPTVHTYTYKENGITKTANYDDDATTSTWAMGDYGNYYVKTDQEYVDDVKSIMQSYSKKGGNIMFIEDRCTGSGLRTWNGNNVSTFGDTGYYGSFDEKVTTDYTATLSSSGWSNKTYNVTMSDGEGAVGFKVYDGDGKLVAISNTNVFSVSQAVYDGINNGTYTVKVAQGNGVDYFAASTGHDATHYEGSIPYILKFNGTEVARGNAAVENGDIASEHIPSSLTNLASKFPDWISYSCDPTTINANTSMVEVTATWNGPFEFSTDFASAKWYNMHIRSGKYVFKGDSEPYYPAAADVANKKTNTYQWAFSGSPYAIKLWNRASGTGYTLAKDGSNVVMREGDYTWTILPNSDGFVLKETGSENNYVNQNGGATGPLQFWNHTNGATDDGSTFRVEEIRDVTYNLVFNNQTIKTATKAQQVVGESTDASGIDGWSNAFVTLSSSPETIQAGTTEVTVTATWNGPFDFSTDFNTAKWYNMSIRGTKSVAHSTAEPYTLATGTYLQKASDAYQWAFSGTPYGLIIWNKDAGSGSTMTKDGGNVVMRSGDYTWTVQANSDGFVLKETGTINNFVNDVNNKLQFWDNGNGATDNGSTFRVEDIVAGLTDIANLSNNKAYIITNERATWNVTGANATTMTTQWSYSLNDENLKFAIIKYENQYYLYNIATQKFLTSAKTFSVLGEPVTITDTGNANYPWFFSFGSGKNINIDGNGTVIINSYGTKDEGNSNAIIEVGSFDPTAAIAMLQNNYERVKSEILPFIYEDPSDIANSDPAPSIGKPFGISSATVASFISTYGTNLANQNFTNAQYTEAKAFLEANIIYLENGKYYIVRNVNTGKYLNVQGTGRSEGNYIMADLDTWTVASIVKAVTINEDGYYLEAQGKQLSWAWNDYTAYSAFLENSGKHVHYTVTIPGQVAFELAIGHGEGDYAYQANTGYYQPNSSNVVVGGTKTGTNAQWTFEEITSFPVTMNKATNSDTYSYATLYVPFDVTISGAEAYTLTLTANGEYVSPTVLENNDVPAGTGVLLRGDGTTATAYIRTTGDAFSTGNTNILNGSYFTKSDFGENTYAYVLNQKNGVVGFYKLDGTLGTNKAYLPSSVVGELEVKGFVINWDDTDGIVEMVKEHTVNGKWYDLSGRLIVKPKRGMYIVNGKKVIIKSNN